MRPTSPPPLVGANVEKKKKHRKTRLVGGPGWPWEHHRSHPGVRQASVPNRVLGKPGTARSHSGFRFFLTLFAPVSEGDERRRRYGWKSRGRRHGAPGRVQRSGQAAQGAVRPGPDERTVVLRGPGRARLRAHRRTPSGGAEDGRPR